jgi:hemerythrin
MALGNVVIDAAHMALLDRMLVLLSGPDCDLDAGLSVLVDKLERDFRAEEEFMEGINFPDIRAHREEHARVLGALHHIGAGDAVAAREALQLMSQWFPVHLATLDTALAVALDLAAGLKPAGMSPSMGEGGAVAPS